MMAEPVGQVTDRNPIINDPYEEPTRRWEFGEGEPRVEDGRRESGWLPPVLKGGQLQITDVVAPLQMVNQIRSRVKEWREAGYPGATAITRELFDRWFDPEREPGTRPFFAQQEAIESIAFLTEAPADRRVGLTLARPEAYERWAVKLATGAGKTLVMAMVIAWSGLNKAANRQDTRFADAFLVICPNLTVKQRLSGIEGLKPSEPPVSAYRVFDLIPSNLAGLFGQARVLITNWHGLAEETDPKRSVLRRGLESDAAFCRRVLRELGDKRRIMVLNDEAHHAWRPPPALHLTGEEKKQAEQATVWIRGLERIHRDREILRALDFSATPMYPGAIKDKAWRPFEWIVSDFALVDAIESGLVKVPRIPTDDNAGRAVPKYRNLWEYVKKVLPKKGTGIEAKSHPLTDYLTEVDGPLKQLSGEWEQTFKAWEGAGRPVPPVLIVVCNETKMAELLAKHIAEMGEAGPELENRDGQQVTVRIDSRLLEEAEIREEAETAQDAAERIRQVVATVGKQDQPGEQVRCVISVGMLSEGWDARNVTQILGLRAFQSQLLCEQVVGRGLRRTDYSNLSQPEYVDVYGVPFQLLPFVKGTPGTPIEPPKTTTVRTLPERAEFRQEFPRVVQIVPDIGDTLDIDIDSIEPVRVSAEFDPTSTYVEFEAGAPHHGLGGEVQDKRIAYERFRLQRLVFRVAAEIIKTYDKPWLFPRAVRIVQEVVDKKVTYERDVDRRELCNLRYITQLRERIEQAIRPGQDRTGALLPVLNEYEPIGSTDSISFSTGKPCEPTIKSHLSHGVYDSKLELEIMRELEQDPRVLAYAKNDRLFLEIPYRYLGRTLRYLPDFIVRLESGMTLLIEGKGRRDEKDDAKWTAARRWVAAVNSWGKLGTWAHTICYKGSEVAAAIESAEQAAAASVS
jgi:type III restriction enzyme